jgi:hypothetical protein
VGLRISARTPAGLRQVRDTLRVVVPAKVWLTTDKPIYQPGQTIHLRTLALRSGGGGAVAGAPLTFEVRDFGTKGGHLVDLTAFAPDDARWAGMVRRLDLCAGMRMVEAPQPQPPFDGGDTYATELQPPGGIVRHPDARFDPERLVARDIPAIPTDHAPYFAPPRFDVRQQSCG